AAAVDDGDAIRHRQRLALVVGHVDGRRAKPVVQLADLDLHRLAELLVERRQRLVHQHDRRLEHDGARERDALALAAGQFVDAARTVATELDGVERGLNAPCDLGRRHAAQLQRKRDVARDVHVREERVALEHEAYVALVGCEAHDLALAEAHAADVRPDEPGQDHQERRLAGAGGSEQRQELAAADIEVDGVERARAVVRLRHPADRDRDRGARGHRGSLRHGRATRRHSDSMFWYRVAARASFLMYQARSIGSCFAALAGYEGRRFAYAASIVPRS